MAIELKPFHPWTTFVAEDLGRYFRAAQAELKPAIKMPGAEGKRLELQMRVDRGRVNSDPGGLCGGGGLVKQEGNQTGSGSTPQSDPPPL